MKKYLLMLICCLGVTSILIGQTPTKYKVELRHNFFVNSPWNSNPTGNHFYLVRPYNGNSQVGPDLISVSPTSMSPTTTNIEKVVSYSNTVDSFRISASSSFANCTTQPNNGIVPFSGSECSFVNIGTSDCIAVNPGGQNRFVPIEDFSILNAGISPQIKLCETKSITVVDGCDMKYAVIAFVNGSTTKEVILPYAVHPGTININLNNINGLTTGDQVDLQIEYVSNPSTAQNSIDISDKLTFDIFECAPQEDTSDGIDVPCFDGKNGGFTITFDRDLKPLETLNINLIAEGTAPGVFDQTIESFTGITSLTSMTYTFQGMEGGIEIPAGRYVLDWLSTLTNSNGLSSVDGAMSSIITVGQPTSAITVDSNIITPVSCSNENDGAISIVVSGGTGPYTFDWSNPSGYSSTSQNISSLSADTYSLIITDSNLCETSTLTFDVEVIPNSTPELEELNTVVNQLDDFPFGEASITLGSITGGDGNYAYRWTRIPDAGFGTVTTRDLTNLTEGDYVVIITEDNGSGCQSIPYDFTINPFTPISVVLDSPTPDCIDGQVLVSATVTNGIGVITYRWFTIDPINGEELIVGQTGSTIFVPVGEYKVEVSDASLVTADASTIISVDDPLAVTESNITDVICAGESTGRITLNISGGASPYRVFWDGSNELGLEDNIELATGDHTYEVRDSNDCIVSGGPIFIGEPTDVLEVTGVKTDVTVNGGNDGTILLTITNGTTPFQFNWEKQEIDGITYSPYSPTQGATLLEFIGFIAGTYQVTVTDGIANACTATMAVPISIIQPGPLELQDPQFDMTPVACFGASTGQITANYTGTGPFVFVWRDGGNNILKSGSDDFLDSQPAGFYTYTIDDATAAAPLTSDPIGITQPTAALEATLAQTEVTCFGGNDGTITVSASGGTAPLQYLISGGPAVQLTPGAFTNLEAGAYTINVIDANGCSIPAPLDVELVPPTPISFDDANAVTPVTSPGGSDGSISVTVQGGAQPFFYRWTGPAILTPINTTNTTSIQNLPQGVYTLEVSNKASFDIDGCYFTRQYTVTEQAAFSIQSLTGTPTCFNQSNGTLTATIAATGPVTFNWTLDDGTIVATETTALRTLSTVGLADGNYYLEIVDTNSQSVQSTLFEIVELPEVSATITPTLTCLSSDTGSITFSNPIGSPSDTYSYSIDNGLTFQASPIFENLAAGSYTLRVSISENNNCDFIVPGVTISNSPGIFWDEPNTLITRASGAGATDGAITPTFIGGTAPLSYLWSANANNATSQNITQLAAGTYTVTVTDAAGCSITQSFEVTEVGPLTITNIIPTNVLCKDEANGSISTTVTGEGTITYLWTLANGAPVPLSNGVTEQNITGILAGSYILTATDDNTTVITAAIVIGEPATTVTITNITPTDVSCFGDNDGALEIQAAGGTGPYTYSINGGAFQTSTTFNGLIANSYTVRVRDVNACEFAEPNPVLLLEPLELDLIINEQRPVTAANETNGAIFITAEGGSGNFTYEWSGPNGFTSTAEDVSNLAVGNYIVTITDVNYAINNGAGCRLSSAPIAITEPGVLIANLTQTVLLECSGDTFAEITANVQGGVAPYTYEWFQISNGNNTVLDEDSDIIANLSVGTYFLSATDANSITIDTSPITITAPTQVEITVDSSTDVICAGQPTGSINITVSGGTPPYQYFWSNSATVADISGLDAGDYTIEVEDANGCIAQNTVSITTPDDTIQIADVTVNNVSAYQALDGSISLDIAGGLAPYTYIWTRLSDNSNAGDQATISNLAADSYLVSVSDTNGCTLTETYQVTEPDIVEDTIVQPSCTGDSDGSINVLVNQGNGIFTYLWNTGATENNINNLAAGSYMVTISGFADGPIERTYMLENPVPLEVDLGDDRVLCADQVLVLDASVDDETVSYSWTSDNGFISSEPNVILSETGNYTVTVQSQTGCTTQGTIFVDINNAEIDAQFAMSSQAFVGETLVAVDISFPLPEGVEWIVPIGAEVVTQDKDAVEFSFAEAGEYEITIITTRGDCIAQKTKKVLVVAMDGLIQKDDDKNGQKLVEEFLVYPNPTSGQFTADISLSERGDISIKVFSFANNNMVASTKERGETAYSIPFDISGMPSGVYAILLETPYGTSLRKIIIR